MNTKERDEQLATYARAADDVAEALKGFPRTMWAYKPGPERWSIHEILVHLADSEANSYVRCRRAVAEPGSVVMAYDEERWAAELHYHDQDPQEALALFRNLRSTTTSLLRALPASAWARTMQHSERGPLTLDDWLAIYAAHGREHIEQMKATHAAWRTAKRGESVAADRSLYAPLKK